MCTTVSNVFADRLRRDVAMLACARPGRFAAHDVAVRNATRLLLAARNKNVPSPNGGDALHGEYVLATLRRLHRDNARLRRALTAANLGAERVLQSLRSWRKRPLSERDDDDDGGERPRRPRKRPRTSS